jgi:integrase
MAKLTVPQVKNAKPGSHSDGGGLMLVVGKGGAKSWILRMQRHGKRRDIGLGSARDVSLAEAREAATATRKMILNGIDPVAEKRKASGIPTFKAVAETLHAEHLPTWKNDKHAAQWLSSLTMYAFPDLGELPVNEIDSPTIRDCLIKVWLDKPETARRVRQRVCAVLDYAYSKGWRDSETPVRAISMGLPKQPRAKGHHAALPWKDVPGFVQSMSETLTAGEIVLLAIEFTILTACRSGEVRGAKWNEVDHDARLWTIPADRMKAGKAHRVPLSDRCMAILSRMAELRRSRKNDGLIFEGMKPGRPLSDMSLTMPLRRAGIDATLHGFRSSFRDWCAEATDTPREIAEACLAHTLRNKVEAAYARTDHLDRRRDVINAWSGFVGRRDGEAAHK